ncbi:MAG: hypothetical protein VKL20_05020 [Synechocystis sp.]|nr:hypothetical protein [Synechocystis sp.]
MPKAEFILLNQLQLKILEEKRALLGLSQEDLAGKTGENKSKSLSTKTINRIFTEERATRSVLTRVLLVLEIDSNNFYSAKTESDEYMRGNCASSNINNVYLVLKVEKSNNNNSNKARFILTCWLDDGFNVELLETSIEPLTEISLKVCIGKCILEASNKYPKAKINIEFFVARELLCKPCENESYFLIHPMSEIEKPIPLKLKFFVNIRWSERWKYMNESRFEFWKQRHDQLCELEALTTDTQNKGDPVETLSNEPWVNLGTSSIEEYVQFLIEYGTALVIWSRCRKPNTDHFSAINTLIQCCNLQTTLNKIYEHRRDAPSEVAEDSTHLGHHLAVMYENPHRKPPWLAQENEEEDDLQLRS